MQSRTAASSNCVRFSCGGVWKAEMDGPWRLQADKSASNVELEKFFLEVRVVDSLTAGRQHKDAPYKDGRSSHVGS